MSGHSKWAGIKHKKAIVDGKRGKAFTKHAALIIVAARAGGGDLSTNATLRFAIESAKKDNVPNDNIERAIKKGTGELKDGAEIQEVVYEAYGPGGLALIIDCLTDNKNRTVTNLRTLLGKWGGRLGESGSVGYLFDRKGVVSVPVGNKSAEELELLAIDSGADDFGVEEGVLHLTCPPSAMSALMEAFKKAGAAPEVAEVRKLPKTTVTPDAPTLEKITALLDALDEDLDVNEVAHNGAF